MGSKNHYIISHKIPINNGKYTCNKQICNQFKIRWLQINTRKDAKLDFKRALVRPQKSTFYKSIKRLLEAKKPCIDYEMRENS